jgi:hypothetical protein
MGFPDSEAPWIELGFASQKPAGHVYYEPTGEPFDVPAKGIRIAAWIITAPSNEFAGLVRAKPRNVPKWIGTHERQSHESDHRIAVCRRCLSGEQF